MMHIGSRQGMAKTGQNERMTTGSDPFDKSALDKTIRLKETDCQPHNRIWIWPQLPSLRRVLPKTEALEPLVP
jgi:hypothetical protein